MDFFYHSPVDFCIVGLNSIKELGKGDQRDILGCYVVVLCKNVKIFFLNLLFFIQLVCLPESDG